MSDEGREGIVREQKKCPVDRGELLIGLEHCLVYVDQCKTCPYFFDEDCCSIKLWDDARAYIGFLEAQLGVS